MESGIEADLYATSVLPVTNSGEWHYNMNDIPGHSLHVSSWMEVILLGRQLAMLSELTGEHFTWV